MIVFSDSNADTGRRFNAPASFDFADIGPFPWKRLYDGPESDVSASSCTPHPVDFQEEKLKLHAPCPTVSGAKAFGQDPNPKLSIFGGGTWRVPTFIVFQLNMCVRFEARVAESSIAEEMVLDLISISDVTTRYNRVLHTCFHRNWGKPHILSG